MASRTVLRIVLPAVIALCSSSASASLSSGDFMAQLREASAVAPLRMRERTPTAVLPGYFSGRRADAVLITNDSASLCRGPDYRRCLELGHLPATRTVPTTVKGESLLLVLDSLFSIRACSVDVTHDRATLNCRAVDQSKLIDYNAAKMAGGQLLLIEGTDGKYACSANADNSAACSHIATNGDGMPIAKSAAQKRLDRKHGPSFKPLDQPNTTCRVRNGEIRCGERPTLGEFSDSPFAAMMRPAALTFEDDEERDRIWDGIMDTVYVTGSYSPGTPAEMGFWTGPISGQIPRPPNYYRQQCLDICAQQDIDYGDACRQTALWALVFGPTVAAGYFIACEGGRAYYNQQCRGICG